MVLELKGIPTKKSHFQGKTLVGGTGFEPATHVLGIRSPDQASDWFSEKIGPVYAGNFVEERADYHCFVPPWGGMGHCGG